MAKPRTDFISWIALFISIFALVLAWNATNSIAGLTDRLDQLEQPVSQSDINSLVTDTRDGLSQIVQQIDQTTDITQAEISDELTQLRNNLSTQYQQTEGDVQAAWSDIDSKLEQLETDLRQGSAEAVDDLQAYLEQLEADLEQ